MIRTTKLLLSAILLASAVAFSWGCTKEGQDSKYPIEGPVRDDEEDPDDGEKRLRDAPFKVGCTVIPESLSGNGNYRDVVTSEFSSMTAENAMKMKSIWKSRNEYYWDDADMLVNFAVNNGIRMHGHALIWYKNYPDWLKDFSGTREEWIALMEEYIKTVVTRYKGKITSWDVVNEAINNDGTGYRGDDDIWYRNIGPEYIDIAFRAAHEADPDVLLFYNDYGMEWGVTKRTKICDLVNELKAGGCPIHGIGIQMHTDINRSRDNIRNAIQSAYGCGVKVHISELDVDVNPETEENVVPGEDKLEKQKQIYRWIAEEMQELPADANYGITTWGVYDGQTWIPDGYPLMFDKSFGKKPAYYGILESF